MKFYVQVHRVLNIVSPRGFFDLIYYGIHVCEVFVRGETDCTLYGQPL
ncbi:MAG: hypothetical protein WA990_04285 [Rubrobacteraceae bacterium]